MKAWTQISMILDWFEFFFFNFIKLYGEFDTQANRIQRY